MEILVLDKVITPTNLLESELFLKDNNITLEIVNKSRFEFELLKKDNLGLKVTVYYNDKHKVLSNSSTVYNNATEVHFNFKGSTFAIESDIHSTGMCPYNGNKIVSKIVVELETEKAESF